MKLTTLALSLLASSILSSQAALVHAGGNVVETTSTNDIWTPANISDGLNGNSNRFVTVESSPDYFASGGTIPVFELDLGAINAGSIYDSVAFWGYFSSPHGNSATSIEVIFSDTAGTFTNTAHVLSPANLANTVQQDLALSGTAAERTGRYVQLRLLDNAGDNRVGMSEIQFNTVPVPEPSSSALLGLSGLALILRRRR